MFSRFQTGYRSNCPEFPKVHLYPVWVNSNFDPLWPDFHPLFAENIQYLQGFAVLYPMNMHFNASIYAFRWPKFSAIDYPVALQVIQHYPVDPHFRLEPV